MTIYFAGSTNGFYDPSIHGSNIPADAVEISAEEHVALLDGQSVGKRIVPNAAGRPVLADPPAPSINEQKADTLVRINAGCEAAMARLRVNYPDSEVMSWSQQSKEADALAANPDAAIPLLTAIAAARGLNVTDLAARVRAKTAAYAQASGQIIGQRQALEDALMAVDLQAPDAAEQLEAITWPAA